MPVQGLQTLWTPPRPVGAQKSSSGAQKSSFGLRKSSSVPRGACQEPRFFFRWPQQGPSGTTPPRRGLPGPGRALLVLIEELFWCLEKPFWNPDRARRSPHGCTRHVQISVLVGHESPRDSLRGEHSSRPLEFDSGFRDSVCPESLNRAFPRLRVEVGEGSVGRDFRRVQHLHPGNCLHTFINYKETLSYRPVRGFLTTHQRPPKRRTKVFLRAPLEAS